MAPIHEDFAGQRQLRFRVRGKSLHLFKRKGESTHHVFLKVLAYALYGERYELEIDPDIDCKFKPHVANVDWTGEVRLWIHCGEISLDQVAYILKHSDAEELVLVREHNASQFPAYKVPDDASFEDLDLGAQVAYLKRHIHYRYATGKLRLLVFRSLDEWFVPDDVEVLPEHYHMVAL